MNWLNDSTTWLTEYFPSDSCFATQINTLTNTHKEGQRGGSEGRRENVKSFMMACNLKWNTWSPLSFDYMLNGFCRMQTSNNLNCNVPNEGKRNIWLGSEHSFTITAGASSQQNMLAVVRILRNHIIVYQQRFFGFIAKKKISQ